jgi:hypothetical protein
LLWTYYRALKQREGAPIQATANVQANTTPAPMQTMAPIVKPKAAKARRANA